MEDTLFTLLGLGVPFSLGAATYAVFAWLDSNASGEATQVISSWPHGRSHNKPDLGNLIINAFDRIYTSPLFSLRAFRRSAAISSVIWVLLYFAPWLINYYPYLDTLQDQLDWGRNVIVEKGAMLFIIVLIDYVSLLFVPRFLVLARTRPIGASVSHRLLELS